MIRVSDDALLQWAKGWASAHWHLPAESFKIDPLTQGGSARRYFRVAHTSDPFRSLIASAYDPDERKENALFVSIARFLYDTVSLPVPQIYAYDEQRCSILIEDVGTEDLFSFRNEFSDFLSKIYAKTIRSLIPLYADGLAKAKATGLELMPGFDAALYAWEQNYFLTHAIKHFARIELSEFAFNAIDEDMQTITRRLLAMPQTLVHRDLQSQNILIRSENPIFIDFQGMRVGTYFYDLASLIYDPYALLNKTIRERLIQEAFEIMPDFLRTENLETFTLNLKTAAIERLMQALGAYGNLGLNLGKPHFLKHILPAASLLSEVLKELQLSLKLSAILIDLSQNLIRLGQAASCQAPTSCSDSTADPTPAPRLLP